MRYDDGASRWTRTTIGAAVLLVACTKPAAVANKPAPRSYERETAALTKPYLDGEWVNGVAVGLLHDGVTETWGFGGVGADTVFEIGSVTKVFTALVLLESGLPLDAKVSELLGRDVCGRRDVTLEQLATHTSGLPRLPTNLEPKDGSNPYADYGVRELDAFLGACSLSGAPGREYEYSNLGVALLGRALVVHAKASYEDLVARGVTRPLGMTATSVARRAHVDNARGHDANGDPATDWTQDVFAPAGALRSTARDLLAFLRANVDPDALPAPAAAVGLPAAIRASHASRVDAGNMHVALGWHVDLDGRPGVRWHNGGTGGFHSFVAFDPERRAGVVVLANTDEDRVDDLGAALLRTVCGEHVEPAKLPPLHHVDAAALDAYVGAYAVSPTFVLTVTRAGERLYVQATDQSRFRVYPTSDSGVEFAYRVVDARLTFERDGSAVVLHQGGRDRRAPRVPPAGARQ